MVAGLVALPLLLPKLRISCRGTSASCRGVQMKEASLNENYSPESREDEIRMPLAHRGHGM